MTRYQPSLKQVHVFSIGASKYFSQGKRVLKASGKLQWLEARAGALVLLYVFSYHRS